MSKVRQLVSYSITMVAILIALLTTGCMSEVDSAIKDSMEKKDGSRLVELYSKAKNNDEKSKIAKAINKGYLEKLEEISKKDLLEAKSKDLAKTLEFVENIDDNNLAILKRLQENFSFISKSREKIEEIENSNNSPIYVANFEKAETLEVYVKSKIKNAANINIAGIDVTERYSGEFEVSSYQKISNIVLPTKDWEAAVVFKKGRQVKQGVAYLKAIEVGSRKVVDPLGFEKNIPIYYEIWDIDIKYSRECANYKFNVEPVLKSSKALINRAQKGEQLSAEEIEKISPTVDIRKRLYGTWKICESQYTFKDKNRVEVILNAENCKVVQMDNNSIFFNVEINGKKHKGIMFKKEDENYREKYGTQYYMEIIIRNAFGNQLNDGHPGFYKAS